jgi:hypothetical protein
VKQNISTFLIARSQLDIGDLLGKGMLYKFSENVGRKFYFPIERVKQRDI